MNLHRVLFTVSVKQGLVDENLIYVKFARTKFQSLRSMITLMLSLSPKPYLLIIVLYPHRGDIRSVFVFV